MLGGGALRPTEEVGPGKEAGRLLLHKAVWVDRLCLRVALEWDGLLERVPGDNGRGNRPKSRTVCCRNPCLTWSVDDSLLVLRYMVC